MTTETKGNLRTSKEEEEKEKVSFPAQVYKAAGMNPIAHSWELSLNALRGTDHYKNASKVVTREFEKKVLNPDNLEKGGAQSQKDKNEGKQPSVSDQFFEAIGFFMPTIVGGLVGGAIEGSEGALAGAELGMKAGKQFADYKEAQQARLDKLALAGVKQRDIKTFVKRDTGEPIIFNAATNAFEDLAGNPVDRGNAVQATTFRQTRSLQQREEETEGVKSRFDKRFNLTKKEKAQLSGKQVESLGALDESLRSLSEIKKLKPGVNTGPFASRGQSASEIFGLAPEKFTTLKTEVGSMVNNYIKAITGAQMQESEAQRIMSVAPNINDDDATFSNKLKAFTRIVDRKKGAILNAIKSGQPLRKDIAEQMAKEAEEALKQIDKKSGSKRDKTSAERKASWDKDKLKRYEEYKKEEYKKSRRSR